MHKTITPVVSVILLIMLTIVASIGAYAFINSEVNNLQDSGAIENSPYADNSRLNLVSITGNQALVRNDGSSPVTEMVILINGETLNYTLETPLMPGELKIINYTARETGIDLEIKVIYNQGKTVQGISPASKNLNSSGFTNNTLPLNPVGPFYSACPASSVVVNFNNNPSFSLSNDLACGCNASSVSINNITNPSFETGSFTGWSYRNNDSYSGFSIVINNTTPPESSSYYAQITNNNDSLSNVPTIYQGYMPNTDYLGLSINGFNNTYTSNSFAGLNVFLGEESGYSSHIITYIFYGNLDGFNCDSYHPMNPSVMWIECIETVEDNAWNHVVLHPVTDYLDKFGIDFSSNKTFRFEFFAGINTTVMVDDFFVNSSADGIVCDSGNDGYGEGICSNNYCYQRNLSNNNAGIVKFDYGLKGYCNISSNDPNDILSYNYSWTKNGEKIINNIFYKSATSSSGVHYCINIENNSRVCWGDNNLGSLGNGLWTSDYLPNYYSDYSFESINSRAFSSCGLLTNGSALCWGQNNRGQLGNGSIINSNFPVFVSGNYNFSLIKGGETSCGILTNGSAVCWGYGGNNGNLGNGLLYESEPYGSTVPVFVSGNYSFKDISPGGLHVCGLLVNGSAVCWGYGTSGQLGNGNNSPSSTPVFVSGNNIFSEISLGHAHACALTNNSETYCWGYGEMGQLGTGFNWNSNEPVKISGDYNFIHISSTNYNTCGLLNNGSIMCWGRGTSGEVGNGSLINSNTPQFISSNEKFNYLYSGYHTNCAGLINGSAMCWGDNYYGGLGNGSIGGYSTSPLFVQGTSNLVTNDYFWNKNIFISLLPSSYYTSGDEIIFECSGMNSKEYYLPKNDSIVINP